jgi:predicted RNA-binding protein with PIN domain
MRYLIVDGHSIIFAWPELRKLHAKRGATARDRLVRLLTEYQDATGIHVVAVFDGTGSKSTELSEPGGIQVFYSAATKTADDIVERLVAKYGAEHDITVATSDRLERQTAVSFGAMTISPESLQQLLTDATTQLERTLKTHRRRK